MQPLTRQTLFGTWAPLLLPIQPDDSIDYDLIREEIDVLITMRVNGIYSNGTAGEFYAQSEEEFEKVSHILAEKCNAAGMPFQIGCCHTSPQVSLERIRRVRGLKPSAIQVILPDWYPPSMDEIVSFLGALAASADPIGLVLYNPPHAKFVLGPSGYRQIRDAGIRLVGCKVAGGDEAWYASMKSADPDLALFVPGHHLATGVTLGAQGSYSNVACLNPRVATAWYDSMSTEPRKAADLELRLRSFISQFVLPYMDTGNLSGAAVDKLLAAVGGWGNIGTRVRWPYKSASAGDVTRLRDACHATLPEFF